MRGPEHLARVEAAALAALDPAALEEDVRAAVRLPSVTGEERDMVEWLGARAAALGLVPDLVEHDLPSLRAHAGYPGEEAPRSELLGLRIGLSRSAPELPRLALCGHLDVVGPGTAAWRDGDPFSGQVRDGRIFGRGSADMKSGVLAGLHALAALERADGAPACRPELLAVSSEEDGGLGAFAALECDAGWAACVVMEPTGFDVVCAQAGALTFTGVVHGVAAHAAYRRQGVSAIDRYLPVHAALRSLETTLNEDVEHALMAGLGLPYPMSVGKLDAGTWSSSVPDRLTFEGRAPVRVGESVAAARALVEQAVFAAAPPGSVELTWSGGQFASADTPVDATIARLTCEAVGAERGVPARVTGVPWGADMRHFATRGIPTVMCGPAGIEVAHGVDEHVAIADVVAIARVLVRLACRFTG